MKKLKQTALLLAAVITACAFAAETPLSTNTPPVKPTAKASDLFPDVVVARGKGFEIKRSQLDDALISIKSTAIARGQGVAPDLEAQVLDRLIQIQLLLKMATDADRAKGQETSSNRLVNVRARAGTDQALERQLKSVGMTEEALNSKMLEEATAEAVLTRELKVTIKDEEIKKYYDENPAQFEQAEMVRVCHILLSTRSQGSLAELSNEQKADKRKQIEALLKRARDGEDFSKLARENSEDPTLKDNGCEYTFTRGQMVAEFEAAAFGLQTNQISDVITTQYGYHIIKLLEKIPAKKVELAKVSAQIEDFLRGKAIQAQMPAYVAKLKKEAGVEVLDDKLKVPAASAAIKSDGKSPGK